MRAEALELIRRTVVAIPRGEIATYGGIARRAGLPGRARMGGHALKVAPRGLALPWHRVVGSGGAIKLLGENAAEQRFRLRMEGIGFRGARVDMKRHEFQFAKGRGAKPNQNRSKKGTDR